jgi:hypothetical protein
VALVNANYLDGNNVWHNDIVTLVDSGGCENGVNTAFALANGFDIHDCSQFSQNNSAISATGSMVHFKNIFWSKQHYKVKHLRLNIILWQLTQNVFDRVSLDDAEWRNC